MGNDACEGSESCISNLAFADDGGNKVLLLLAAAPAIPVEIVSHGADRS
jgi:hypothetical protein